MSNAPSPDAGVSGTTLTRLALALVLLGIAWRTVRYLLRFPFWGDEAMLAVNFALLDYGQLAQRLENCQIAPILFLWAERAAFDWLGPSELSLRLLPYLAGVASLVLFWRLARRALPPLGEMLAVGFLAVAIWPVSMSTQAKPYSLDLLVPLLLLVPAAEWMADPSRIRWLVTLALIAMPAMLTSYPAVFVAGSIGLAVAPLAWHRGATARAWLAAYAVALLAGFLLGMAVGKNHLATPTGGSTTAAGMTSFWEDGFPPGSPLAAARWFVLATAGQVCPYPLGAPHGGSALTVALCIVGGAMLARSGRWAWLALCIGPVLLNLAAAALRRYPYGGAERIMQHLAPGICLLAGGGLAFVVGQSRWQPATRIRLAFSAAGAFALIGLGGVVRDILRPIKSPESAWVHRTMDAIRHELPTGAPVVVCSGLPVEVTADQHQMDPTEHLFGWYLLTGHNRPSWNYRIPKAALDAGEVHVFHRGSQPGESLRRIAEELHRHAPGWRLVQRLPFAFVRKRPGTRIEPCSLCCFRRQP